MMKHDSSQMVSTSFYLIFFDDKALFVFFLIFWTTVVFSSFGPQTLMYVCMYVCMYVEHIGVFLPRGDVLELREVKLQQHFTEAPQHLSESELLELMDRHGIGTSVVGGWGCCSRGKTMLKTKKFPFPPQLLLLKAWGWERRIGYCWLVILGMSWMWGLETFVERKMGWRVFLCFCWALNMHKN